VICLPSVFSSTTASVFTSMSLAKNSGTVPGYSTSKISNHHSTITNPPLAPPRGSGCLKVVKNAGTVPGWGVTWGLPPGGVWGMLAKERADARESCSDYWVD